MSEPVIAAKQPIGVELEAGKTYHWCACGSSKSQPFCDGSHAGSGIEPLEFTADSSAKKFLCQCKHTKNPPFCDGAHSKL